MVMKKSFVSRRVGIAEAKAHLSEVIRAAGEQPIVIHNRGTDVAVVLAVDAYERLREASAPNDGQRLMADIALLRDQYGGGADIPYERVDFTPRNPFEERPNPKARKR